MKKFVIWLLCVVLTVIVADMTFGYFFDKYTTRHTLPGDYESLDHVLRGFDEDAVILGSSVALNSIDPVAVGDSLGLRVYDGGANGQTMPFFLTTLKAIVSQKKPKLVILGLAPFNLTDKGNGARYNLLAPYYGKGIADIDSRLNGDDAVERAFLHSNFYRLNRIWFRILLYNFISAGEQGENGFIAKPIPTQFPTRDNGAQDLPIEPMRAAQLEEFVRMCRDNDIELMVVVTPRFETLAKDELKALKSARDIVTAHGYRFYNDLHLEPFISDSTLFYDRSHININGTHIYTDTIIDRLKNEDI